MQGKFCSWNIFTYHAIMVTEMVDTWAYNSVPPALKCNYMYAINTSLKWTFGVFPVRVILMKLTRPISAINIFIQFFMICDCDSWSINHFDWASFHKINSHKINSLFNYIGTCTKAQFNFMVSRKLLRLYVLIAQTVLRFVCPSQ